MGAANTLYNLSLDLIKDFFWLKIIVYNASYFYKIVQPVINSSSLVHGTIFPKCLAFLLITILLLTDFCVDIVNLLL